MARTSMAISLMNNFVPWAFKVINFNEYQELKSYLDQDEIEGEFRVTTFRQDKTSWWSDDFYPEIPKITGHYLKLNLTFVIPTWNLTITSNNDWSKTILRIMNDNNIDYILDPVFFSEQIFHPEYKTQSTGLFGLDKISVISRKQLVKKSTFNEAKIFDPTVWLYILNSTILFSLVYFTIAKPRSINSNVNIIFSILTLILGQPSQVLEKINKNMFMLFLILCTFMSIFYKTILLENIMNEPKDWCETLECFANSDKRFLLLTDNIAYNELKQQPEEFISKIIDERRSIHIPLLDGDVNIVFGCYDGSLNPIMDSYSAERFLTVGQYGVYPDDWIITARRDYSLQVGLVRKDHPKSKEMRIKMNECLEFGIIDKWNEQVTDLYGLIFFTLVKVVFAGDEDGLKRLNDLISVPKQTIYLEDFKSTFKLLIYGLITSFISFFMEIFMKLILSRIKIIIIFELIMIRFVRNFLVSK